MTLPWLILAPMQLERRALAKALRGVDPSHYRLICIGIKAIALPEIRPGEYRGIILAGIAGGLAPQLKIGDVVIESSLPLPATLPPHASGTFFHATSVVPFAQAKREIFLRTQQSAVEMESAPVRELAEKYLLPFVHVRGISDAAGDSLDPMLMVLADSFGRPIASRVITALLTKPSLIKNMLALGKNAGKAASAAAQCVAAILAAT